MPNEEEGLKDSGVRPAAGDKAASLIKEETDERPTSNVQRPTSNYECCHF
jgi:hypothetical protein